MGYRRGHYRRAHIRNTKYGPVWVRGHYVGGHSFTSSDGLSTDDIEAQIAAYKALLKTIFIQLIIGFSILLCAAISPGLVIIPLVINIFVVITIIKDKLVLRLRSSKKTDPEKEQDENITISSQIQTEEINAPEVVLIDHIITAEEVQLKILLDGTYSIEKYIGLDEAALYIPAYIEGKIVTQIGANAFQGCLNIRKIVIEEGIIRIQPFAFYKCKHLESISIPSTVIEVGEYAFAYCTLLSQVLLPDGIQEISKGLFSNCNSLQMVNIPCSVKMIGNNAFLGTISLRRYITIPDGVEVVGSYAFSVSTRSHSGMEFNVYLPNSIKSICYNAFFYGDSPTAVFICAENSYAMQYAHDHGIACFGRDENESSFHPNEVTRVMSKIEIRKVSITQAGTDAIVNAANERLWAGPGVCGAIFDAAGYDELTRACNAIGHCDTGSAVITPGFKLSQYIIHAVGPRWSSDEDKVMRQLYSAYSAALRLAVDHGCRSIAFPLISAGIFGVPVKIAWRKAIQACYDFDGDIQIVFAVLDDSIIEAGNMALSEIAEDARKVKSFEAGAIR